MNITISILILFSFVLCATAKPGEPYVLTGREKSIFSIFQADMKAYPELYQGEDINGYYNVFKELNNLNGRKLKKGEELMFPHTKKSKEIEDEILAKTAAEEAAAEEARAREAERTADTGEGSSSNVGSDILTDPFNELARAEAEKKAIRHDAVYTFQHALLPGWICDPALDMLKHIQHGNIEPIAATAHEYVDESFAEALTLHPYPEKNIYILSFEEPEKVSHCFFLGVKINDDGPPTLYLLEKGISFFGTGDVSVLIQKRPGWSALNFGGRKYDDLSSFLKEIDAGPIEKTDTD